MEMQTALIDGADGDDDNGDESSNVRSNRTVKKSRTIFESLPDRTPLADERASSLEGRNEVDTHQRGRDRGDGAGVVPRRDDCRRRFRAGATGEPRHPGLGLQAVVLEGDVLRLKRHAP